LLLIANLPQFPSLPTCLVAKKALLPAVAATGCLLPAAATAAYLAGSPMTNLYSALARWPSRSLTPPPGTPAAPQHHQHTSMRLPATTSAPTIGRLTTRWVVLISFPREPSEVLIHSSVLNSDVGCQWRGNYVPLPSDNWLPIACFMV
jgi:hypothetical protein